MGNGTDGDLQKFNEVADTAKLVDLKEKNPPVIQKLLMLERETIQKSRKRDSRNPINWAASWCSPLSS